MKKRMNRNEKYNIKNQKIKIEVKPLYFLDEEHKKYISVNSYIGKKGYTIPKSVLSEKELDFLKKDLFMKPETMMVGIKKTDELTGFPVYRENDKKIYIPRFYGINRYGIPPKNEIETGIDIHLDFVKPLRDYQEKIVNIFVKSVKIPICNDATEQPIMGSGGIISVPCGRGKTIMALKIISILKKKTLILVHKEFLMNQWIERINEFMPSAKIGKIQGTICNVENKDIVIGMIQTMYDKTFSQELYSQFGFTVIDEVHRIGSEQFSKTLFKTITPYMLGISATVERKDKLTKVLYMFIGDLVYKEDRKNDDCVSVRGIEYISNDPEFNKTEYDVMGKPKYSTMISKLCEYGPRNDFIIKVLRDLLLENPDGQIMLLSHNRNLLNYVHAVITQKNITTIGFYVGGMKEQSLKETETKQIVLATYAMAAEALDIKTLSILVMSTPKTDITQSVGRILRMKHDNPIVVDLIDKHELFQNQWKQRKRFYKKCNYKIRTINSKQYFGMSVDWDTDTIWKKVYDPLDYNETEKKNNNEIDFVCRKKNEIYVYNKNNEDDECDEDEEINNNKPKIGKCLIQNVENLFL